MIPLPNQQFAFLRTACVVILSLLPTGVASQTVSLDALVTPSTVIRKDGHPVRFAIHAFIEFQSLSEVFPYIDSQEKRWSGDGGDESSRALARDLLRRAIESRVVSMEDERPLEALLTHTAEELRQAVARVKEPLPPGYAEAFLQVQEKWKHSLNCWSTSPSMQGRVLSNWYPIEEGIPLFGATYDSTEHFWQAVKYHPDTTIAQLIELLSTFEKRNWKPWLARLDGDRNQYLKNAYAVEFLRHNLTPERIQWFKTQLNGNGLRAFDHAREVQQRTGAAFRFSAFEEKTIWGDLADVFHLVYVFSAPDDPIRQELARHHFDAIYLDQRRMGFISEEFRSLMIEIWKVKFIQIRRFREVIASIPIEVRLEHFLNDGDSPDIPIPVYVGYLNEIRDVAIKSRQDETTPQKDP